MDWDTVRLKHIVIRQMFPNVSKNVHQPIINPLFFFHKKHFTKRKWEENRYTEPRNKRNWLKRTWRQELLSQKERRKRFPFSSVENFNLISRAALLFGGHLQMCYIKLWKTTATAPERRSTKLTDQRQLCAALPSVALQQPARILSRKTVLSLKINHLFSTKPQCVPKKCNIGKLGYVVSALLWQFDTIRNDLSGYGVYTKTMAYRFRIVFKSFHLFYRLRIVFKSLRIRIVFV